MDSLEFAMQLSRQENDYHPGAVRMPGMNERSNSNRNNTSSSNLHNSNHQQQSSSHHHHRQQQPPAQSHVDQYGDVDPNKLRTLTSMGFDTEAAFCALVSNNLDVDQALDFLLGNN